MEITESKAGTTLILGISGRLDATTSPDLDKLITQRLQSGANNLLMDLSQLQYISSAGLRVLAVALKQVSANSGRMRLCGLREPVKMVFDVSGFTSFFPISASVEEALASLSQKTEPPAK